MELETVNKLYLELSQFATPKTASELRLAALLASCRAVASREGEDTAWWRLDNSIAEEGISPITARLYRTLPSDGT